MLISAKPTHMVAAREITNHRIYEIMKFSVAETVK